MDDHHHRVRRLRGADLCRRRRSRDVGGEVDAGVERDVVEHVAEVVDDVDRALRHRRVGELAGERVRRVRGGVRDDPEPRRDIAVDQVERHVVRVVGDERHRVGRVVAEVRDDVVLADLRRVRPEQPEVRVDAVRLREPARRRRVAAEHREVLQAAVHRPLGRRLVRHDVDRDHLREVVRVERRRVERAPDVLADLEHVRVLQVRRAREDAAGDRLEVRAPAGDDLARHEALADHDPGDARRDDVAGPQDEVVVVLVAVAHAAYHEVVRTRRHLAGLGQDDAALPSSRGGEGRAPLTGQHGRERVTGTPRVLPRHQEHARLLPLVGALDVQRHRALSGVEAVEDPAVVVDVHGERPSLPRDRQRHLTDLAAFVGQAQADRASSPTFECLLHPHGLGRARVLQAEQRPHDRRPEDAVGVRHHGVDEQRPVVVGHLDAVQRRRPHPARVQRQRLTDGDFLASVAVVADDAHRACGRRGREALARHLDLDRHVGVEGRGEVGLEQHRLAIGRVDPDVDVRAALEEVAEVARLRHDLELPARSGHRRAEQVVEQKVLVVPLQEQAGDAEPGVRLPDDAS